MPVKKKTPVSHEVVRRPSWAPPFAFPVKPLPYHPSPGDETFVSEYLATLEPSAVSEVTRLACSMAPALDTFDAGSLVAQAVAIRAAASTAPEKRRIALLEKGNLHELYLLESTLKERFSGTELTSLLKPVSEANERLQAKYMENDLARSHDKSERILSNIEIESGQQRPVLPCDHETAFRWALSAPKGVEWEIIERACSDYFCLRAAREYLVHAIKNHIRETAVEALHAGTASATERLKQEETIAEIDALREYVSMSPPRARVPICISIGVESWKKIVTTTGMLALIANCFRAFWNLHGHAYIDVHNERKRIVEDARKLKQFAGKERAAKKERTKWIGFTQDFLTFLGRNTLTAERIDLYEKQEGVPLNKGRDFLKTLLAAKGRLNMVNDLEITLGRAGIKVLQPIAEDCYLILLEKKIIVA